MGIEHTCFIFDTYMKYSHGFKFTTEARDFHPHHTYVDERKTLE